MVFGFLVKLWIVIENPEQKILFFHEEILVLVFEVGDFLKNLEFVDFS